MKRNILKWSLYRSIKLIINNLHDCICTFKMLFVIALQKFLLIIYINLINENHAFVIKLYIERNLYIFIYFNNLSQNVIFFFRKSSITVFIQHGDYIHLPFGRYYRLCITIWISSRRNCFAKTKRIEVV